MTRAQAIFVAALSAVAVVIMVFTVYLLSSTRWGDRWYRKPPRSRPLGPERSASGES